MPASQHQKPKSDIEISQAAKPRPIMELAKEKLGIAAENLEPYGHYKAKVSMDYIKSLKDKPNGKLILVTAITPTPAGEGKTTTTVGLTDALNKIGKKAMLCLREPSLGPCFGVKGGAAGGGYAQVVPMEDINLHFTGDFHAIGSATICCRADRQPHLLGQRARHRRPPHRLAPRRRHERPLRCARSSPRSAASPTAIPREDGFDITVASEVMAIFCLASDIDDLKERLGNIIVGYTRDRKPVRAGDLKAHGADDRAAQGRAVAQSGADAGRHARLHPWRPVRQHRAWLQLGARHHHRAQARRLCRDRSRLRRRSRRREIPRHQVPQDRPGARLRGAGRHHPRAQDARRRAEGRPQEGRPQGAGRRHGQPAASRREHEEVRHPAGGLDQPLFGRHRRRKSRWSRTPAPSSASRRHGRPLGAGRRGRRRCRRAPWSRWSTAARAS